MLVSSAGSIFSLVKSKIQRLVYAAPPLNMQHKGVRTKTDWLRVLISVRVEWHVYLQTVYLNEQTQQNLTQHVGLG